MRLEDTKMSRKSRAQTILDITEEYSIRSRQKVIAIALREAIEGLNIEPNADVGLSAEKHFFIKGQQWTRDAIFALADEIENLLVNE